VWKRAKAFFYDIKQSVGTAVAQCLKFCSTNRKVAVSIPAGVSGFLVDIILPMALWHWSRLSL
jgi:hypothetical protein